MVYGIVCWDCGCGVIGYVWILGVGWYEFCLGGCWVCIFVGCYVWSRFDDGDCVWDWCMVLGFCVDVNIGFGC